MFNSTPPRRLRSKTFLAILLVVISVTTGVVLYRAYRNHQKDVATNSASNVAKTDKDKLDEQIKKTLKENRQSLRFIENKGQMPSDVLYALDSFTGSVWIRKNDVMFRAVAEKEEEDEHKEGDKKGEKKESEEEEEHHSYQAHSWKMQLVGMNRDYKVKEGDPQPTVYSYFDANKQVTAGVRSFKEITLQGVYPGIDLRFYSGENKQIEYDFIVAPGADYKQIKIDYDGQDSLRIAEDKSLELGLRFGTIKTHLPEAYQVKDGQKHIVDMAFKVEGNRAAFEPKTPIDPALPLVIDPTILWGTYFDNNTNTFDAYAYASKANSCGEVYVGGWMDEGLNNQGTLQVETSSVDMINVSGDDRITTAGNARVTVTASGLTGSPLAILFAVALNDVDDDVALKARSALSANANITAKFTVSGSGDEVVLTQIAPALANDGTLSIVIEDVTSAGIDEGNTQPSANTTAGVAVGGIYDATGFDNTFSPNRQAVLYKFNAAGTTLLNLTFFGGGLTSGDVEHANAFIDLDIFPNDRVIAVGRTQGTITTTNPYQASKGSATAANVTGMVVVFDSTLTTLHYSSYLGGGTLDSTNNSNVVRSVIVLDNSTYFLGGVMTGTPVEATFVNVPATVDNTTSGAEGYVARFSGANYNTRDWATFVGGNNADNVFSLALTTDTSKLVFAGDSTGDTAGFPTPVNAVDSTKTGTEVFVGYLDSSSPIPSAFGLLSYAGGALVDQRPVVVADNTHLYFTATTFSIDFPGQVNANGNPGTLQVETQTIAGGPSAGNILTVTVTAAGMTGSPLAIPVTMVLGDDAIVAGGKVRTALLANANVTALFTVGGTGASYSLTRKLPAAADDVTLLLAHADTAGFTDDNTSTNTTAGVASTSDEDIIVGKVILTGGLGNIVSRYLATSSEERAGGILLTAQGEVLIFGSTEGGGSYPTVNTTPPTAFFDSTAGGGRDIVFTYLSSDLLTIPFSTLIGGSEDDYLGDTGILAGSGHLGFNSSTGVITLSTTSHSSLASTIMTAGSFDPTTQNVSGSKDNHITIKFSAEVNDFGDVPLTYDGAAATAARHGVTDLAGGSFARLGLIVDVDATVQSSTNADLDDLNATTSPCLPGGDDEDGVTFPTLTACPGGLPASFDATISAYKDTAVAGTSAVIHAWIDVDGDGLFEDNALEYRTVSFATDASQTAPDLAPWNLSTGSTAGGGFYARFRITTDVLTDAADANNTADDLSRGQATNGEVEDYFIPIIGRDYGDAPNVPYATSLGSGGASHIVSSLLRIGSATATDSECDSAGNAPASIDDTTGSDDETFLGTLSIGTTATAVNLTIPVSNTTTSSAQLCGWIDFNISGGFVTGEGRCTTVAAGFVGNASLSWVGIAPGTLVAGSSYLRLRLSTDVALTTATPAGAQGAGEVEDHPVTISNVTAVDLASFNAYQIGDSVFIDWKTGYESDNLGFNLYRETSGQKVQVTPSLIAGSALMVGSGIRLEAGLTYAWRDDAGPAAGGSQYWLEEVDLNGGVQRHGPFNVASGDALPLARRRQIASQPRALPLRDFADRLNTLGATRAVEPTADLEFTDEKATPAATTTTAATSRTGALTGSTARTAAPSRTTAPQRLVDLSGLSAVKIEVKRAGWYRVPQADIARAGLGGSIDPRNLHLYAEGKQVPIRVTGEEDGSFDTGDAVEFYGVGLDIPSTDGRVYWLMASRLRGQRMPSSGAGGGGSPPPSFSHTVIREDRLVYVSAVMNGDAENFFGMPLANSIPTVTQTLSSPNAVTDASVTATLEVAIQGVSGFNHSVAVSLNGTNLGTINFQGQQQGAQTFQVNHSQLVAGDNLVKLEKMSPEADVVLVDYLKLTYQHAWKADSNSLLVEAESGQQVSIGGFTASNVRILDVTNHDSPIELAVDVTGQQAGGFTATSSVNGGAGKRRLYAFTGDLVRAAAEVEANQPSAWKRPSNGADFLVISHSSLIDAVQPLVALRRMQGWRVAVIDVDDLYDEFAYGSKTPEAISDFIAYAASTWKVKPKAVMLVGKGTYDPRYYMKQGDVDLVPIQMVATETMESAVDDSFADFDSDGVPELAVGRLPVRTPQETALIVSKILAYESSQPANRVALVSDISDTFNFDGLNDQLQGFVPAGVQVDKISRGQMGDTLARQKVLEALDRANKIVNYAGHGSIDLWRGNLLTTADSAALQKRGEVSLFVMMTCLNGYFISPLAESLGESLLRVPGGAVAAWGSSGTTTPEGQQVMNIVAFQHLFGSANVTIGEAARAAKAAVAEPDVRRTWNLLGDPTMRLK